MTSYDYEILAFGIVVLLIVAFIGFGCGYIAGRYTKNNKKAGEQEFRCKDCIYFKADNIPEEGCGYCELLSRTYESEHFCADGERKEGEHGA